VFVGHERNRPGRAAAAIAFAARLLCLAGCAWPLAASGQPTLTVPPRAAPGPWPVACSDVAQDFLRVPPGDDVQDWWEGVARADGSPRYVATLLSEPASTLTTAVRVPQDAELYGSFAGSTLSHVVVACHPTARENARPDYALPNGKSVPHMQRAGEAPWWPDATSRFPVLLFSHGYLGSPLSNDYVDAVALLASYGYVVVAPFHGDGRFGNFKLEDAASLPFLLLHLRDFVALQAVRPLSLSAALDRVLGDPQWAGHVLPGAVGGFGASLGGESLLLMAGAGLTSSLGLAWREVTDDRRLKAAVGYVPYFGVPLLPAFGRDQRSLAGVTLPFLAISGTADTTAPIALTAQGLDALAGPRELVALVGVTHGFDVRSGPDIFTWTTAFLDALLRADPKARSDLPRTAQVAGGGDDVVAIPLNLPAEANYTGLWWAAPPGAEAGWGMNLQHDGDVIFLTWFTYDAGGRAWWLVATADRMPDGTFRGTIYQTRGPPFFAQPFDPAAVTSNAVGTATLTFADADNGTIAYTVLGTGGTKAVTREAFARQPWCAWNTSFDPARATSYRGLWWNAPAGSEAGWGINFEHQGDTIFATWFTYDGDGAPLWLVATTTPEVAGRYAGTLYRTTGPPFGASPFDPAKVSATPVGTARLTFASGDAALFEYTVGAVGQAKALVREVLRAPGTVCH
jgi:predicted dienelactone hydrolase